jgi:phosphoribosylformylglycinamidine (FGAM) synthase-like enzyme
MHQACAAIRDCLLQLGVGIDGGKDSLTMAAKVLIGSPSWVVLSAGTTLRNL